MKCFCNNIVTRTEYTLRLDAVEKWKYENQSLICGKLTLVELLEFATKHISSKCSVVVNKYVDQFKISNKPRYVLSLEIVPFYTEHRLVKSTKISKTKTTNMRR